MNKTIQYYNENAQEFYDRTIDTDLSATYDIFLKYLPKKAHILDAGCGVGRDSKIFLNQRYMVTAFDASREMALMASKETGLAIGCFTFQEMYFNQCFDAVWAQFSLIHIPYDGTREVYAKIHNSLKPSGIFFASYKYGETHMPTLERDFYNMNESMVLPYFEGLFDVLEIWTEKDTRSKKSPSQDAMILNFIARKK